MVQILFSVSYTEYLVHHVFLDHDAFHMAPLRRYLHSQKPHHLIHKLYILCKLPVLQHNQTLPLFHFLLLQQLLLLARNHRSEPDDHSMSQELSLFQLHLHIFTHFEVESGKGLVQ